MKKIRALKSTNGIMVADKDCLSDLEHIPDGTWIDIEITKAQKSKRTLTQNAALHKYCELLAIALNDAGFDMKRTLKPEVDIPWTMEAVKEHLWRPIQAAITQKQSTTEADTSQYSEVYNVLSRHLSQKLGGVHVPWPSKKG